MLISWRCDCHGRANVQEIPDNEYTVKGLVEGKEYEFRVAAVNAAGIGDFSEGTSAIKAAPPPCRYHWQYRHSSSALSSPLLLTV